LLGSSIREEKQGDRWYYLPELGMAATLPCPIGGTTTVTRDHLTTHPPDKELRTSNHLTTHPPDEELPIAASRPTSSEWATGRAAVVHRCATDSGCLLVCSYSAECPWVRSDVEEGAVPVLHLRACARHRRAGGARSRGRVGGGEIARDCLRVRERETRGGGRVGDWGGGDRVGIWSWGLGFQRASNRQIV
jgi:hypothetical protein